MRKAFTLIELVVAVALLAIVLSFTSVIFRVSINAYRTAGANAEIMQKLRAITDQLNTDFRDIRKDTPLLLWFQQDLSNSKIRYDQIMFFADGDFQSTQLYNDGEPSPDEGNPIKGNLARIQYAQAQLKISGDTEDPSELNEPEDRLLARRCHILTDDQDLYDFPVAESGGLSPFDKGNNDRLEHDKISLSQWKLIFADDLDKVIPVCLGYRPMIDMNDPATFHKLMCDGVGSLTIQWAYWNPGPDKEQFRWYPSNDPAGDGSDTSHFDLLNKDYFGVFFNVPDDSKFGEYWYPIGHTDIEYKPGDEFTSDFYPRALKFTFTLYDSKGILDKGQTFTHIVYLDD